VAVSGDGRTLAAGACDGRVSLYDWSILTASGEPWESEIGGVTTDDTPVVGVAFGADDDQLIVAREDGRIEVFSTDVRTVAENQIGRIPELGSRWRLDVGSEVGIPEVRGSTVWFGARDPLTITSGGGGGAVGIPLDVERVADFARLTVSRGLTEAECQEYLESSSCPER
jgi:hypothetical protein